MQTINLRYVEAKQSTVVRQRSPKSFAVIFLLIALLFSVACTSTPPPTPVPTATATEIPRRSSFNDNVDAMNAAQAALKEVEFGFAPLLEDDNTRLRLEDSSTGTVLRLAYPQQPEDPTQWTAVDSFVLAHATQRVLLTTGQVERVVLGELELAAPVADRGDIITHVAVWVTFVDGTQAVIDLSPLSTDFAAQHQASAFLGSIAAVEERFNLWRDGVFLNQLQPMKIVEEAGERYFIVAEAQAFPDRYQFSLRTHTVQVADPMQPLRLIQGTMATVELDRADFETVQQQIEADGPLAFNENPDLVSRLGSDSPILNQILDEHLSLLWHMVTKLEHEPPDPSELVPATPTVTPTPTATPTPTPTPTPELAEPLITS
ncbi:MAG: hypothetical protein R3264_07220 [Anaerolineae bacterium]|nr:hypothetical protein [Anaerolineae bacterium]